MNKVLLQISPDPRENSFVGKSFVGRYVPFVTSNIPENIPFVFRNKPYIPFQPFTKKLAGFTLIELVVTMAVAAILVAVAVPNLRTFIQNGRLNTQTNDLIGDINLARSEAIRRRANVGITTSTTGACATGGNWRDGRVIFIDTTPADGNCNAGETILRFREPLAASGDKLVPSPAVPDPIIFSANGSLSGLAAGAFFAFCDDRGPTKGKLINLNAMGQAAVSINPPGPGDC